MSLGPYPLISLKGARLKRDEIQIERLKGNSPQKRRQATTAGRTFASMAEEWLQVRMSTKTPRYVKTLQLRLDKYILPAIKNLSLDEITPQDVLKICRAIEEEGHYATAHRVRNLIGQVFKFAMILGAAKSDPSAYLGGALHAVPTRHFATLTDPDEIRALIRAIQNYPYIVHRSALMFSILTFARPGEVRKAEWAEIRENNIWDIPADKMKMKRRHLVPLSSQAQELLDELRMYSGGGQYLFPSPRGKGCIHENTVMLALRNLGYTKDQITLHGFRGMASTVLHENGFNPMIIERQLAHVQKNTVARAYNHAEYLNERRHMMQWWGDWLMSEAN